MLALQIARVLVVAVEQVAANVDVVAIVAAGHGGRALAEPQHVEEDGQVLAARQVDKIGVWHIWRRKRKSPHLAGIESDRSAVIW